MHQIMLINVTGPDRPGLTAGLTQRLAEDGVDVLDMGQSVIHDYLTLGILVRFPIAQQTDMATLGEWLSTEGFAVALNPISDAEYEEWVTKQGQPRTILTILGRSITADQLAVLAEGVAAEGLNIDQISRLSGRIPLSPASAPSRACLEWSLRGAARPQFRKKMMALASRLALDVAIQEDGIFRRHRRLVAFDMDSTLIETEVIDELAERAGVGAQVSEITARAMAGELDFTASLKERVALLKGLNESVLEDIAKSLPLTEGVENLFLTLKRLGYKTAILSGGFDYFGAALQRHLGVDYVYANQLQIVEGRLTGQVLPPVVDAQAKAKILTELAAQEGIAMSQTIAVGDGANDLDMLGAAGLGIAYHAKDIVKERSNHAISTLGIDSILYLLGIKDREQLG
jgi:phosphoserine phosphatase